MSSPAGGDALRPMPRKIRHTKSTPLPPPEIRGFLAQVGEVLLEHLEAKRHSETIMRETTDKGAIDDESGGLLPGQ